jgi:hypothetical protein
VRGPTPYARENPYITAVVGGRRRNNLDRVAAKGSIEAIEAEDWVVSLLSGSDELARFRIQNTRLALAGLSRTLGSLQSHLRRAKCPERVENGLRGGYEAFDLNHQIAD